MFEYTFLINYGLFNAFDESWQIVSIWKYWLGTDVEYQLFPYYCMQLPFPVFGVRRCGRMVDQDSQRGFEVL
jgi:hypothetical protein